MATCLAVAKYCNFLNYYYYVALIDVFTDDHASWNNIFLLTAKADHRESF